MNEPKEKALCGAKTRNGSQCRRHPAPGRTRCRLHGGSSLRGTAHPNYQGKGHSVDLPTRLADRFEQSQNDPQLLTHWREAALLDVRIAEIVGKFGGGCPKDAWKQALAILTELDTVIAASDMDAAQHLAADLRNVVDAADAEERNWDELTQAVNAKAKIADRENKRLVDLQQVLTAAQVLTLVTALAAAVRKRVSDAATLNAINSDFTALLSKESSPNSASSFPPASTAAT